MPFQFKVLTGKNEIYEMLHFTQWGGGAKSKRQLGAMKHGGVNFNN